MDKLKLYAEENKMVINEAKTKIMVFNEARKVDILPKVKLSEGNMIEVVDDMKLLGIMIRSDLKWQDNTQHIISKSFLRMWIIRNLKKYGADEKLLIEAYTQQIRSITEMACPVWNGALTQQDERAMERIQRTALAIIRGEGHTTYKEALEYYKMDTLKTRRESLSLKFAIKAQKNPKFSHWFAKNNGCINTRSVKLPYLKPKTRTRRFQKSPIMYLTDLLNVHLLKKQTAD